MTKLSIDLPNGFLDDEAKTLIVPRRRKEIWAVELDLLAQLDSVCKKHGIRYFCDGGTLLGAVRHGGFIPWDDDIDVVMERSEYEKLNAVASNEFRHPYFWQTNETDPGSARGHAQLRNSETTAILKSEMMDGKPMYTFNQGIFLDVVPFDNLPDNESERLEFRRSLSKIKKEIVDIRFHRATSSIARLKASVPSRLYHRLKSLLLHVEENVFRRDLLAEKVRELEEKAQAFNGSDAESMALLTLDPFHREVLPASFFQDAVELDFEFLKIPVFSRYMEALKINYGSNWKEHVIGYSTHGGLLLDANRPYTEYLSGGLP